MKEIGLILALRIMLPLTTRMVMVTNWLLAADKVEQARIMRRRLR